MIPIYKAKLIQIEVTNACDHMCANCTRFVGHHKKPFFMDLKTVRKAIESLEGYKGGIGLMGGEPTMHPHFADICRIYQELIPDRSRRGLWTAGYKWEEYEGIIKETFDTDKIVYNPHLEKDKGWHQPLLVASDEIIDDKELMWGLIDNCWVQRRWSASITPKGCFFCEVAAALDQLFEGKGGYPIKKGWWNKKPEQFQDQVKRYCVLCSAAIPFERQSSHSQFDIVSKGNAERLRGLGSPKLLAGGVKIYDKKYTYEDYKRYVKDWAPNRYRDFVQFEPGKKYKSEDNGRREVRQKQSSGCG